MKRFLMPIVGFLILFNTFTHAATNIYENTANPNETKALSTNKTVYTQDQLNITVNVGQPEFTLQLKSNPSTGYTWFLRDYDHTLIEPIRREFKAPNTKLIGAPGMDFWTFRIKTQAITVPQQTVIRMIYARPWEGEGTGSQVVFHIFINNK